MHKPLTLLQRLAVRAEASDCDCQTDDADLLNEAIAALAAKEKEIDRYRNALETIAINMHGSNPSLVYADAPREDYLAHVLWEARQLAFAALKGDAA